MAQETPAQPKLADLMARYLSRQSSAHAAGLGAFDPTGEVVPFEAGPVQPVDPRLAWDEAVAVLPSFGTIDVRILPAPPLWPQLVTAQEPVVALAYCVGNYPQLLRNLHPILHKANLSELRPSPGRPVEAPALLDWVCASAADKRFPRLLLAVGALRLAKQYDQAAALLAEQEAIVPAAWQAAWANEKAALAWHRGQAADARAQWQTQPDSVAVHFNRGMAALFLDDFADARQALAQAVTQLPEAGSWHHLGKLYLALAQARG